MPLSLQGKLLTTIERRLVRPVGGSTERKVNVHIIAATNRNLEEAVESGEFREDLYHRLRVLTVFLPPLRQRGNDIEILARHFLQIQRTRFGAAVEDFSSRAIESLRGYDWPGNVRELMHTIERSVLFSDSHLIEAEHLGLPVIAQGSHMEVEISGSPTLHIEFSENGPRLDEIEHQIITTALQRAGHNLSRASRWLGISRDAIRYRLDRFEKKSKPS